MLYGLGIGQSNLSYDGTGGYWDIDPLVEVWNNENDRSDLVNKGTAFIAPVQGQRPFRTGTPLKNNSFVHCLSAIAVARNESVRGVLSSKGGQGVGTWYSGSARQANLLRALAVADASRVTKFDFVIMALGESDNGSSLSLAVPRYNAVFRELGAEGLIDGNTPIVICEASVGHEGTNEIMASLIPGFANRIYLPTRLQPTGDGTHFTGAAAPIIGQMMADAVLRCL